MIAKFNCHCQIILFCKPQRRIWRCYWKRGEGAFTWDIRNGMKKGKPNVVDKSQLTSHDMTLRQPYI